MALGSKNCNISQVTLGNNSGSLSLCYIAHIRLLCWYCDMIDFIIVLLIFRSALQEILVHVLKQVEPCQVLHLLYTLAFKMNPSDNLSLSKSSAHSNGAKKDEKEVIFIPLMDESFVFAYGDEGGALIRYQSADEQFNAESILRDLQGNDLSGSEVQAQCIVELLRGLNKDAIAGDFFIYLTQELTKIISDFSEEIEYKGKVHIVSTHFWGLCFHSFLLNFLLSLCNHF